MLNKKWLNLDEEVIRYEFQKDGEFNVLQRKKLNSFFTERKTELNLLLVEKLGI